MINLDMAELRPKIDLENKYVDFSLLRTALTVAKVVGDLNVALTKASKEGECRGKCPKCGKDRSFALNVNTNRFNCFAKGCILKGGGVIDLFAKLHEVPAKDASHLLACAYGIQPYSQEPVSAESAEDKKTPVKAKSSQSIPIGETVSREEFTALSDKVERLSTLIWSLMLERGEIEEDQDLFEDREELTFETAMNP
jgi:hypothetical protein